ncbi:DUF5693 family protein [Desulfotruncus alcoholivorax]|uniref:DUF5693 family protein n=1 Tax=Desulfotruncus alcoholivorax TaxID=265477 RepID=UPI0004116CD6|nr:DUF5693 family protein [Desulfotruncus alcoholivorax]
MDKKWTPVLIAVVVISIIAAGYLAWQRHTMEANNRSVQMAVVYDEVASLARMNGTGVVDVLRQFRERGAGAVLIKEPTVAEAEQNGEFKLQTGQSLLLMRDYGVLKTLGSDFWQQVRPDRAYFIFSNPDIYQRVKGQLTAKKVQLRAWERPGLYILEAGCGWSLLQQLGVGFPQNAVDDANRAGMQVLVQLRSWNQVDAAGLKYVFGEIGKIPGLAGLLFNDPVLPGAPDQIRPLAYVVQKLRVPVVAIEFSNQIGLSKLGYLLDKNVVRLHTLSLEEDAKKNYSPEEIIDRYALAATERNIRILLFHSYTKPDAPDILQWNLQLAGRVGEKLRAEGMQVGEPSVLAAPLSNSRWLLFLAGLGAIAGGMLLCFTMGWPKAAPLLGLVALLAWAGLLGAGMTGPARKLMAFASVVIFPTLSLSINIKSEGSTVRKSVLLLLRTSLISLTGALLMVGLLADRGFMLKLDQFAGVKLAHVAPLLLLALIFFFRHDEEGMGWRRQLQKFLDQPILVKSVVILGILAVALLIYVSRTGNESVAISPLELKFRSLLDTLLGVRPRTKEFLVGHPLLLLVFYLGYRNNNYMPLLLAGAIGQISLVNTYAHIHTPLAVSLLRSFNGLVLGIIVGLALIALWRAGERLYRRLQAATETNS